MSNSINQVEILGNVGADPEYKTTTSGTPFANLSIATSKSFKDESGNWQNSPTQWHRVTFWTHLADRVCDNVKKGDTILVKGELQYSKFEKDGQTIYKTDIIAKQLHTFNKTNSQEQNNNYSQQQPNNNTQPFNDTTEEVPF